MVIEAGFKGAALVALLAPAAQRNEADALAPVLRAQGGGELVAREARHADVEQRHVRAHAGSGVKGGAPIKGQRELVAAHLQQQPQALGSVAVVVGHQDAAGAVGTGNHRMDGCLRLAGGAERQPHLEVAALSGAGAAREHRAAVQFRQPLHQRQTDAQAAFGAAQCHLGLREHAEQRDHAVGRETDAVVRDGHHQLLAFDARAQRNASARVGVLGGVGEQVRQQLRDAQRIRMQRGRTRRQLDRQRVALGIDHRARRLHGHVDDRAQRHVALLELELALGDARDVEQVVEQVRHLAHLALDDLARPLHLRRLDPLRSKHLRRAAHGCKRVAQFVRQRCEKHVFLAVGFAQRFEQLPLLGDVPQHAREVQRAALAVALAEVRIADGVEPVDRAVAPDHAVLDVVVAVSRGIECRIDRFEDARAVLRVKARDRVVEHELTLVIDVDVEHAPRARRPVHRTRGRVELPPAQRRGRHGLQQPVLALLARLFAGLEARRALHALGHVEDQAREAHRAPLVVHEVVLQPTGRVDPAEAFIVTRHAVPMAPRRARSRIGQRLFNAGAHAAQIVRVHAGVEHVQVDRALGRRAHEFARALVPHQSTSAQVPVVGARAHRIDGQTQPLLAGEQLGLRLLTQALQLSAFCNVARNAEQAHHIAIGVAVRRLQRQPDAFGAVEQWDALLELAGRAGRHDAAVVVHHRRRRGLIVEELGVRAAQHLRERLADERQRRRIREQHPAGAVLGVDHVRRRVEDCAHQDGAGSPGSAGRERLAHG